MVRCGFPSMKLQSLVGHNVAKATLQQLDSYYTTMPPQWANACGGCAVWPQVGLVGFIASPV